MPIHACSFVSSYGKGLPINKYFAQVSLNTLCSLGHKHKVSLKGLWASFLWSKHLHSLDKGKLSSHTTRGGGMFSFPLSLKKPQSITKNNERKIKGDTPSGWGGQSSYRVSEILILLASAPLLTGRRMLIIAVFLVRLSYLSCVWWGLSGAAWGILFLQSLAHGPWRQKGCLSESSSCFSESPNAPCLLQAFLSVTQC